MEHIVRAKDGGTVSVENYGRAKAIKVHCTECMGFVSQDVKDCTSTLCPLYPYRGSSHAAYHGEADEQ